jgi:hypothetical protein
VVQRSEIGCITWIRIGRRRQRIEPPLARAVSVSVLEDRL